MDRNRNRNRNRDAASTSRASGPAQAFLPAPRRFNRSFSSVLPAGTSAGPIHRERRQNHYLDEHQARPDKHRPPQPPNRRPSAESRASLQALSTRITAAPRSSHAHPIPTLLLLVSPRLLLLRSCCLPGPAPPTPANDQRPHASLTSGASLIVLHTAEPSPTGNQCGRSPSERVVLIALSPRRSASRSGLAQPRLLVRHAYTTTSYTRRAPVADVWEEGAPIAVHRLLECKSTTPHGLRLV